MKVWLRDKPGERTRFADDKLLDRAPFDADAQRGITLATRYPAFMYATRGCSCVVHKIARIELDWYVLVSMTHVRRLRQPNATVWTVCGNFFPLSWRTARTCRLPSPDAIRCGRCHGEVAPFGKDGWARKAGLPRQVAHVRLGCAESP